jgi:hypothetical protein
VDFWEAIHFFPVSKKPNGAGRDGGWFLDYFSQWNSTAYQARVFSI